MMFRCVVMVAACAFTPAFAGDLNPPLGPVAPTMKTLDDVEPRIAINAENTPGDADSTYRIASPGSYYLTENVTHFVGSSGIEVASSNVTIDLNGYRVSGLVGSLGGVVFDGATGSDVVVKDGSIVSSQGGGVLMANVSRARVERVNVSGVSGGDGIRLGSSGQVTGCAVQGVGGYGIRVSTGRIEGCTVDGGAAGFACFEVACCGSITDCHAISGQGTGFSAQSDVVVERCVATATLVGFSDPGGGVIFRDCNANFCTDAGFVSSGSTTFINCQARGGSGQGFDASGGDACVFESCQANMNTGDGFVLDVGSRAEGCVSYDNGADGLITVGGCVVRGCDVFGNGGNGIVLGSGSFAVDCVSQNNAGFGVMATICVVRGCTIQSNASGGIEVASDCVIEGNALDSNFSRGIRVSGSDNRIDGNSVTDSSPGIQVVTTGNIIVRNTVAGASAGAFYFIVAGNATGTIQTSPVDAGPWDNFEY